MHTKYQAQGLFVATVNISRGDTETAFRNWCQRYGVKHHAIAPLKGGTDFQVYPIKMVDSVKEMVLKETKEFWDLVVEARPIYNELEITFDNDKKQQLREQLDNLEPEPEQNKGYEDFWKEKCIDQIMIKPIFRFMVFVMDIDQIGNILKSNIGNTQRDKIVEDERMEWSTQHAAQ